MLSERSHPSYSSDAKSIRRWMEAPPPPQPPYESTFSPKKFVVIEEVQPSFPPQSSELPQDMTLWKNKPK